MFFLFLKEKKEREHNSREKTMAKLIIQIPESIAELLGEALRLHQELSIKTKDLTLELTASGQLTKCEFKKFEVSFSSEKKTPVEIYKRPRSQNQNQTLEDRVEDRRKAILEVIQSVEGKPLKMSTIASYVTKRGYPCASSTVSVDINALLKSRKISFFHERGSGRIYKVLQPELQLDNDFVF